MKRTMMVLAALCIVLGILLNYGIAGIMVLRHGRDQNPQTEFGMSLPPGMPAGPGMTAPAPWPGKPPETWPASPDNSITMRFKGVTKQTIGASALSGPVRCSVFVVKAGWPLLALEAQWWQEGAGEPGDPKDRTIRRSGLVYNAPNQASSIPGRDLFPLRPVWPGFVINTAIYSIAALIPVGAAWFLLSKRRRPGVCPKCAHDLSGLPPGAACPECGKGGLA